MKSLPAPVLGLLLAAALPMPAAAPATAASVAVFEVELYDTSLEGEMRGVDPAETARLESLTAVLRQAVEAHPKMTAVDTASLKERLAAMPALYSCNGCEAKLAGELGAERSVSAFVYKVSTLILYITVSVRDTASGKLIEQGKVSIRGNTDESWQHGLQYLLKRKIFQDAAD